MRIPTSADSLQLARMIVVAGPPGSGKSSRFPLSAFGDEKLEFATRQWRESTLLHSREASGLYQGTTSVVPKDLKFIWASAPAGLLLSQICRTERIFFRHTCK